MVMGLTTFCVSHVEVLPSYTLDNKQEVFFKLQGWEPNYLGSRASLCCAILEFKDISETAYIPKYVSLPVSSKCFISVEQALNHNVTSSEQCYKETLFVML